MYSATARRRCRCTEEASERASGRPLPLGFAGVLKKVCPAGPFDKFTCIIGPNGSGTRTEQRGSPGEGYSG